MSDALFQLDGISFGFTPGEWVLHGVSGSIFPGDRIALSGNNGAGKTTLLHLLVGLLKPQAGRLIAFGSERSGERHFRDVRLRTGLVFEDSDDQLFCATVAEDVAFGPFNKGWPRERVREAVASALGRVGLAGYEDRITDHLSHGEKRLVCLASVLAMEPDVLLLDEPTDGLDAAHHRQVREILTECSAALVIVSHDQAFLNSMCRSFWRIENGRLLKTPG